MRNQADSPRTGYLFVYSRELYGSKDGGKRDGPAKSSRPVLTTRLAGRSASGETESLGLGGLGLCGRLVPDCGNVEADLGGAGGVRLADDDFPGKLQAIHDKLSFRSGRRSFARWQDSDGPPGDRTKKAGRLRTTRPAIFSRSRRDRQP